MEPPAREKGLHLITLASIVQQPPLAFDRVAEMMLGGLVLTVLATALLALIQIGWGAGIRWMRHRRSSIAAGENAFVGRFGPAGPELFVVGAGARRLPLLHGRKPHTWWRETGQLKAVLSATMLAETLGRRPSRELAWAFVEERLVGPPGDGFVLETSEVLAWLDARHTARSERGRRAREAAGACAASVALRLRRGSRPTAEDRVPGAREAG